MKLDYDFLKEILLTLEAEPSYSMKLKELGKKLDLGQQNQQFDKLEGHVKLLADNGYVEFKVKEIKPNVNFMPTVIKKDCRLTSKGYEFLDILRNDTILNKIKNFALPTAFEIGKQLLIKFIAGQLT